MGIVGDIQQEHLELDHKIILLHRALVVSQESGEHEEELAEMAEALHEQFRKLRRQEQRLQPLADHVLGEGLEDLEDLTSKAGELHEQLEALALALEGLEEGGTIAQVQQKLESFQTAWGEYNDLEQSFYSNFGTLLMPGGQSGG